MVFWWWGVVADPLEWSLLQMVATPKSRIYPASRALAFVVDLHSVFDILHTDWQSIALPATGFQHADVTIGDPVHNTNVCVSTGWFTTTFALQLLLKITYLELHDALCATRLLDNITACCSLVAPTCMVANGRNSSVQELDLNRQTKTLPNGPLGRMETILGW
jgi:hypothetical protein